MLNEPSRGVNPPVPIADCAHAGRQQCQCGVVAAVQRQRTGLIAGDDLAALARIGLEPGRRRQHLDPLRQLSHLHRQVDALPCADRQLDAVRHRNGEPGLLGGDQIGADS